MVHHGARLAELSGGSLRAARHRVIKTDPFANPPSQVSLPEYTKLLVPLSKFAAVPLNIALQMGVVSPGLPGKEMISANVDPLIVPKRVPLLAR